MRDRPQTFLVIDTALDALGVGLASLLFLLFLPVFGFVVALVTVALNTDTEETVTRLSGALTAIFGFAVVVSFALGLSEDTGFVVVSGLAFCGGLLAASVFWRHGVAEDKK